MGNLCDKKLPESESYEDINIAQIKDNISDLNKKTDEIDKNILFINKNLQEVIKAQENLINLVKCKITPRHNSEDDFVKIK